MKRKEESKREAALIVVERRWRVRGYTGSEELELG